MVTARAVKLPGALVGDRRGWGGDSSQSALNGPQPSPLYELSRLVLQQHFAHSGSKPPQTEAPNAED